MFEPLNDHHAIQEVTMVLTFERPFTGDQVDQLDKEHASNFRKELPKRERHDVFQVAVGQGGPFQPPPQVIQPLSFSAFKRDGSVDWRLLVDQSDIVVNCLTYTRWKDVSARALNLLRLACQSLMRKGNHGVSSVTLQYLDTFKWRGKTESYDVSLLLREDSDYVPKSIFANRNSALWHLHQGWFSNDKFALPGKTLQRTHLDAVLEGGSYSVRMDTSLRLDLTERVRKFGDLFGETQNGVTHVFDQLHQLDKSIIRSYITDEMASRISLDNARVADR